MANRNERIIGAALVAATIGGATFGAYEMGKNDSQPTAIVYKSDGGMPSSSPINGLDVQITPAPSAENTPAMLSAVRIENAQAAATRFGADAYSQNPSNWEINEYGGAHLKETEKAVKVKTAGAVLEGWFKAPMTGENTNPALTLVADPTVPMVEVNGATLWDFGANSRAGFEQVLGQVEAKEPVEQPGVTVVPLCGDLQPVNTVSEPVNKIASAQEAASMFGADAYSRNPANWDINEYGGAHLKETGTASLVNLSGATLETWIKGGRINGRDALTFVVHANVGQMRSNGGTFWDFANPDGGFKQLYGQVLAKEAVEQPDVTVLPADRCVANQ